MPFRLSSTALLLAALALACGGQSQQAETSQPKPEELPRVQPLATEALAGQSVIVLPLTLAVSEDSLTDHEPFNDRARLLFLADSVVGATLQNRAPDVKWVLPPELRKIAGRAQGLVPEPDHMGQALLRSPKMEDVPDPLWSYLRSLTSMAGARMALVPAMLEYFHAPEGYRAQLTMAVADSRTGRIPWRTVANGMGPTPTRALTVAMNGVLPLVK